MSVLLEKLQFELTCLKEQTYRESCEKRKPSCFFAKAPTLLRVYNLKLAKVTVFLMVQQWQPPNPSKKKKKSKKYQDLPWHPVQFFFKRENIRILILYSPPPKKKKNFGGCYVCQKITASLPLAAIFKMASGEQK